MAYPKWEAGKLYLPGALVQPVSGSSSTPQSITNAGFESGDTGWTKQTGWTITAAAQTLSGTWSAKFNGSSAASIISDTEISCTPGQTISATCRIYLTTSSSPSSARALIDWYTSGDAYISSTYGNLVNSGAGTWQTSIVSGAAPATAAYGKVGCSANKSAGHGTIYVDGFTVAAPLPLATSAGLVYKAVQADPGISGDSEPTWPSTLGLTVVDNEVTWEAVQATRVVWQASPVLVSSGSEPTWPTEPGATVVDGSIAWVCKGRHITDENCPNNPVVAIMASKVFAADGDIVRFCATANVLDWTSERDAGYIPTGLQQANANDIKVLAPYRSHLAALNANCFQMWQVDPDPTNMALLDQMEGVGSIYQGAAQPVANELLYLSQQGVRSVGIANAAENLQAGDIGMPIDPLIKAALASAPSDAVATYYPGAGQFWLCFQGMYLTGNAPDTVIGATYSHQYASTGGAAPVTYAVTTGALPAGLSMSSSGLITGTPTTAETQAFVVTATDANNFEATVSDSIEVFNYAAIVCCTGSNTVQFIDSDNAVAATISVDSEPRGLAVSADLSKAYAFNRVSGTVSEITIASATLTATIEPVDMLAPLYGVITDGMLYVGADSSDNVNVIDLSDNSVLTEISGVGTPRKLAALPNGAKVYVADYTTGEVHVITTASNTITATISGVSDASGVAVSPDGATLWLTEGALTNLVRYASTATDTLTGSIAVGAAPLAIALTPDGAKAYVANNSGNSVSVINTATFAVTATIAVGTSPRNIGISSDGETVYVANAGSNNVSVISVATDTVIATISTGSTPDGVIAL